MLPIEIEVALIGVGSVLASAVSANLIAKKTCKNEIDKIRLTWSHEKSQAFDLAFSEMIAAVEVCIQRQTLPALQAAIEKTSAFRAIAAGDVAEKVDELAKTLTGSGFYADDVKEKLTETIKQVRIEAAHNPGDCKRKKQL